MKITFMYVGVGSSIEKCKYLQYFECVPEMITIRCRIFMNFTVSGF